MSSTGGGKKGAKGGSKKIAKEQDSDRATPASVKGDAAATDTEMKDETPDPEKKEGMKSEDATTPKPQVSPAQLQRDAAQKVLNLALKQEWTPMESTLKSMEKMVAAGGEEISTTPLAGVMDPVSVFKFLSVSLSVINGPSDPV